jgi:hypothetical protein
MAGNGLIVLHDAKNNNHMSARRFHDDQQVSIISKVSS